MVGGHSELAPVLFQHALQDDGFFITRFSPLFATG